MKAGEAPADDDRGGDPACWLHLDVAPPLLPGGLELRRTSPLLDDRSMPADCRRTRREASESWGRLAVRQGTVTVVFDDALGDPIQVIEGEWVVIPPERPHHFELADGATFVLESYGAPAP